MGETRRAVGSACDRSSGLTLISIDSGAGFHLDEEKSPVTNRPPHYVKAVQQLANNLGNVKTIIIHHFHPSIDEIFSEFVGRVVAGVNFGEGAHL